MSKASATLITATRIHVRRLAHGDLPKVLQVAEQLLPLSSLSRQFPLLIQSRDILGCVAEIDNHIAGFAICAIVRQPAYDHATGLRSLLQPFHRLIERLTSRIVQVDLLQVAVASEWQACGVERKLLQKLDRELRHSGSCVKLTVPETNLSAQLFLHEGGYRATQVLRGYYASEDGYLFESE
jgi:ribosomal protein S18 acetylase RimI-like enzyme